MTFQHAFDRVKRVCMAAAVMMVMAMLFMAFLFLPTNLPTPPTAGGGAIFLPRTGAAAGNKFPKENWAAVGVRIFTNFETGGG